MNESSEDTDQSLSVWEGDASAINIDELWDQVQARLVEYGKPRLQNKTYAKKHVKDLENLNLSLRLHQLEPDGDHLARVESRYCTSRFCFNVCGHQADIFGCANPSAALQARPSQEPVTNPEETARWKEAFEGDFKVTPDFKLFLERLERIATCPKGLYARVLPIIQGSGVGKSRMLDEAAEYFFTFPICLRVSSEDGNDPVFSPSTLSTSDD